MSQDNILLFNNNIIFSQQTLRTFRSKHWTHIIKKSIKTKKTAFYENNNISNTHHAGGNKVFIWCSRLTLNLLWQLISLNTIKTRPSKCVYITLISRWSALRHCPQRDLFDACNKRNKFFYLVSLFKGRGTQSQFLKTFYDFIKILYNWQSLWF